MNAFVTQHARNVIGTLCGWDRLRLRGSFTFLCHPKGLLGHLLRKGLEIRQFGELVHACSAQVGRCVEKATATAGRKVIFLRDGKVDKEQFAHAIAERDGITRGLVTTLSAVENCRSFKLGNDRRGQAALFAAPRRCLHYYHYLIHPLFGWMYLRIQSWLPLTVQVGINGREWLGRQMDAAQVGYLRKENCFLRIADLEQAQELARQQVEFQWEEALSQLVAELVPGLAGVLAPDRAEYYWSMEQSEWAHDTMFRGEAELAGLYPGLIRHGIECLGSREVLRFLGHKVPVVGLVSPADRRELSSSLKARTEGTCLKHRLGKNQIKCYNKQGSVFRTEVTINDPRQFKVPRREEDGKVFWAPMRKGVADARRRAEVSQAATERYLDALAAVSSPTPLKELARPLSRSVRWGKQPVRGLRLLEEQDSRLLQIVGRGEYVINGFRNRDLQAAWFGTQAAEAGEKRRRSGQITRKLRLLRAHGLIHKLPGTHRYQVSDLGRQVIAALLAAENANIAQLTKAA